jgi:hypothetical protein
MNLVSFLDFKLEVTWKRKCSESHGFRIEEGKVNAFVPGAFDRPA